MIYNVVDTAVVFGSMWLIAYFIALVGNSRAQKRLQIPRWLELIAFPYWLNFLHFPHWTQPFLNRQNGYSLFSLLYCFLLRMMVIVLAFLMLSGKLQPSGEALPLWQGWLTNMGILSFGISLIYESTVKVENWLVYFIVQVVFIRLICGGGMIVFSVLQLHYLFLTIAQIIK